MNAIRVVIADDHRPMLDSLVELVSAQHHVVGTAHDGAAAADLVDRLDPDVLVLDIAMPGLSGIAAATRLRQRGARTKIVFVTMYDHRELRRELAALGIVGFVSKDRIVTDLLPAISTVLSGRPFASSPRD